MAQTNHTANHAARLKVYLEKLRNTLNSPPAKRANNPHYMAWLQHEIRRTELTLQKLL